MEKIVYIKGLWSHPYAVNWIKEMLESFTEREVLLFDYHDLLVDKIGNREYLDLVLKKFYMKYGDNDEIILIGHSHGGTLASILNKEILVKRIVLVNPAIKPWGVFRRIPNFLNGKIDEFRGGDGYTPHFVQKFDDEASVRADYFLQNFNMIRDFGRVIYTGKKAVDSLKYIKNDLLLIQSMADEFVSISSNLRMFNQIQTFNDSSKEIYKVDGAEHAILEEMREYPKIYKKINTFINK